MGWSLLTLVVAGFVCAFGLAAHRFWPRELVLSPAPKVPVWELKEGRALVKPAGAVLFAEGGCFDEELVSGIPPI